METRVDGETGRSRKGLGRALTRRILSMSLRTRLIAAFVILIVTSASATIGIGNVVFGRKVLELATSKVEVGLTLTELYLKSSMERLEALAAMAGQSRVAERLPEGLCQTPLAGEEFLDFALAADEEGGSLFHFREAESASPGRGRQVCREVAFPGGAAALGPDLEELARRARDSGQTSSGLVRLDAPAMERLALPIAGGEGLAMVAAAPLDPGRVLLLAAVLNGHAELVSEPVRLLWPGHEAGFAASLFLRDRRMVTTFGESMLGTQADPAVAARVLGEGKKYFGTARVVDRTFYTAYMPLTDFRGERVGIFGIGAEEEVYNDVRNRTITLFSSLIAGGMLFGFLMTYLFSALLIRPVVALSEGMNRVARGELDYKVRLHSSDELGQLAQAFNLMVKAVRERDIRLREMTEERLSQVEKQVSVGRLAAGVAHEINNPLTSILTLSMLLLKHCAEDHPDREDLEVIVTEATRCRDIVRNLLDFARERPSEKRIIDLNSVIRDTVTLTSRYEAMDGLTTELLLSEEKLLVNVDPKQLQQVFMNLIVNAAEASRKSGAVRIRSDEDSSGAFVVVRVSDAGKGIPKAHINRVFEPFFTTKGARKGTGLGLSVSLGIVRKHNGTIEIESEEGRGTTVTVMLPRAPLPGDGAAAPEGGARP
jgi:two-component system NtrC family sensor kinase